MSSGILMLCVNYFFETDSWTQSSWQRYGLLGHTKFIKGLVYIIWTNTLFLISPQISEISKFINGEQVSITALSTISDQEKIKKVTDVFHFEIYCTHSRGDCYQEIIWSNLSVYL